MIQSDARGRSQSPVRGPKKIIVRLALGILAASLLLAFGYKAVVFVITVANSGEVPAWTYGEGKFTRFKHVATHSECSELAALLDKEQPQEFNRRREELGLSDTYLDLSKLNLSGRDLQGVDLSKCVLSDCNFSGCNLRGASFKHSYVAQTTFCGTVSLQAGAVTPKMARVTDLTGSHFDGATFKAVRYFWVETASVPMECKPTDLQFCTTADSTGIAALGPSLLGQMLPITVSPTGPKIAFRSDSQSVDIVSVSTVCENPFRDIPDADLEHWSDMGVDVRKLCSLPACRVDAGRVAFPVQTIVNSDSNLVVVVSDRLPGMMSVVSAGPLVAMKQAQALRHLISDSAIWVRGKADFYNTSVGHPIVVSEAGRFTFGRTILSPVYIWPEKESN